MIEHPVPDSPAPEPAAIATPATPELVSDNAVGDRPGVRSAATERIEKLEQDVADVDQALSTLEELHAESKGRGGSEAADRIRAVVSAERFPAEARLPADA